MRHKLKLAVLLGAATLTGAALAEAPSADGAAVFTRCAACHTASGGGVPGAFPALNRDVRMLAARPEGRRYLALVVMVGLAGPVSVDGQSYASFMPAQTQDPAEVTAVLNHLGTAITHDGPPFRAFTLAEVTGYAADAAKLAPSDLGTLHATLEPAPQP